MGIDLGWTGDLGDPRPVQMPPSRSEFQKPLETFGSRQRAAHSVNKAIGSKLNAILQLYGVPDNVPEAAADLCRNRLVPICVALGQRASSVQITCVQRSKCLK